MDTIHISKEAKDKLLNYYFPGNVRELKAMIDLAAVMCENNEINDDDITYTSTKREKVFMSEQRTLRQQKSLHRHVLSKCV